MKVVHKSVANKILPHEKLNEESIDMSGSVDSFRTPSNVLTFGLLRLSDTAQTALRATDCKTPQSVLQSLHHANDIRICAHSHSFVNPLEKLDSVVPRCIESDDRGTLSKVVHTVSFTVNSIFHLIAGLNSEINCRPPATVSIHHRSRECEVARQLDNH